MRAAAFLVAGVLSVVLMAGCNGDDNGDAEPTVPTVESPVIDATEAPEATEPSGGSLPDTPVVATLDQTYDTAAPDVTPADEDLPVPSGSVEARWYQSEGRHVIYYAGLSLADSGPICPGNSIQTANGFEFVSNSPTAGADCVDATLAVPPAGVMICGEDVLYVTEIPAETEGTLYGTIEVFRADGTIIGLTSTAESDAAAQPEVDLSSCSPAV